MVIDDNSPPIDNAAADVREAIASLKGEPAPASAEPVSSAPPATNPDESASDPREPSSAADRSRDEHGRFVARSEKPVEAAPAAQQPPAKPLTDADPGPVQHPTQSEAPALPKTWSAELKADFAKASPALQQAVLTRLGEVDKAGAQWSEEKKTLLGHFEPLRATSTRYNVAPQEVIKRLAAANDFLEADPRGFIDWIVQNYGVDLSQKPTEQSRPQADPIVSQLATEVSSLKNQLVERQLSEVGSVIADFSKDKPYWDTVFDDMVDMIPILRSRNPGATHAQLLQDAYDRCVWANPELRQSMVAAQTAEAEKALRDRQAVDKARRGALSLNGAPNGAVPVARPDYETPLDAARAAWNQHRGH